MARRTQAMIMQAFMDLLAQKSVDKITVTDVIEKANVNRNTFYYYYDNIPSLLGAFFEQERIKFSGSSQRSDSLAEEYQRACALFRENRAAISHIYQSENRKAISNYLETAAEMFVGRFVRKAAEPYGLEEEGIRYVTHFYSYAIVGLTMHWIQENMPLDDMVLPERIESTFYASVEQVIADCKKHSALHRGAWVY